MTGFPWSECLGPQARESDDKSLYQINVCRLEQKQRVGSCVRMETGNTRKCVQSPLVVLSKKVRKEGGYFYGKFGNENYT